MVTVTVHPSFCCSHNKGLRGPINTARTDRAVAPSWLMWAKQSREKLLLVQCWAAAGTSCKIRSMAENRSITGIHTLADIEEYHSLADVEGSQYTEILNMFLILKKNHVPFLQTLSSGLLHKDLRSVRNIKCTSLFSEHITCIVGKLLLVLLKAYMQKHGLTFCLYCKWLETSRMAQE